MDNQQNNVVTNEGQNNMTQQNAPQVSEEQLRRTYKGIEFRTEDEKNQIIALEQAAVEYCESLSDKSYDELYAKHQEWSKLPSGIFMPYTIKIMSEIGEKEKQDIEAYKAKIENASLEELDAIKEEVTGKNYSSVAVSQIYSFLNSRKRECQINVLEQELVGYASLSREDLKALREKIYGKNFESDITNTYINKINDQYDVVEQNELQNLCANIESMGMKELEGALRIITNGGYQEKYSAAYITLINNKIEELQYKELEEMTAGKEQMSKEELSALYEKLQQGEYNPKFVKKFILDVRILLEKIKYTEVMDMTKDVWNSDKATVSGVESAIEQTGYGDGVLLIPRKRIADKKFEFDMCELIDICNDYDSLDNEAADKIIADVNEKEYCQRSKNIYLDRISQRKFNIALSQVTKLGTFFVQTANKYGLPGGDILVASKSDAYMAAFRTLKNAYPTSGSYDVPAFIMSGSVNLAISYKYCYLNIGSKQTLIDVYNISGFKTVKKLFIESLVLELRDGSTVAVSGSINKQILPLFIQVMNEFIANINNKVLIDSYQVPEFNVPPLNKEWYICKNNEYTLNKAEINSMTISAIYSSQITGEMSKAMHYPGNKDWDQYQLKVKTNYQLMPNENLLFVYDKTLLNSAKEGFAVSEDKLIVKKTNQATIILTMSDIFAVICDTTNRVTIVTTGLSEIVLDMMTVSPACAQFVATKLDEYVKNTQLYSSVCN